MVLRLRINGQHLTEEGQQLIPLIAQSMNDGRLFTNKAKSTLPCAGEIGYNKINLRIQNLLYSPSNYEVQANGRILIVSAGTYLRNSAGAELYNKISGVLLTLSIAILV